jgi:hypothetical protein
VIFGLVGFSIFINLALHDFYLGRHVFANIGGPSSFYIADLKRHLSVFEYAVSVVNALAAVVLYAGVMFLGWRATSAEARPA